MKRNIELIRSLLFAIESNPQDYQVEGFDEDMIKYHVALLIDAGLVEGTVANSEHKGNTSEIPLFVSVRTLTWSGHEFVANLREESVWNTIKKDFKDASFSTVLSVEKQLAERYAKKKVEALLSI